MPSVSQKNYFAAQVSYFTHFTILIETKSKTCSFVASFGIHSPILNWFKSYLSSRSFRVRCNNTFSSLYTSSCGVLQGSVLGPLLFIMYTTPSVLSSPPFSWTTTIPLCRRHSTVFSHFTRPTSTQVLPTYKNALQQISSWMTANLLTLNSSKTKFLLIGLKKQLDNIHNSSLNTTHSVRNLYWLRLW